MINKLLLQFLDKAKLLNAEVEPIKVLKTNTSKIGKASILIRTASDLGKRFFFGINYINAEEIYNLDNSFIAFICGSIDQTVFIPADILIKHLPQISHDRNGEYKINFSRDLNLVLKGKRNLLDCSGYINNWDSVLNYQYLLKNIHGEIIETYEDACNRIAKHYAKGDKKSFETLLLLFSPFMPHICEELWHKIGNKSFISEEIWPAAEKKLLDFARKSKKVLLEKIAKGEWDEKIEAGLKETCEEFKK